MTVRIYVVVLFLTVALLFVVLRLVRRHKLRAKYAILWVVVTTAMLPFAILPHLLDRISQRVLGINYPPAALMLVGFVFFCALSIHFSYELSRQEERLRRLAEEIALLRSLDDERVVLDLRRDRDETTAYG
jgi:hypothetical protein